MFRILLTKLPTEQKIKITNISKMEEKKPLIKQQGSSYHNYEVRINLNMYNDNGTGIPGRHYYGVDSNGNIVHKPKSLARSIFHEFTHCLHHIEDAVRYDAHSNEKSLPKGILRNTWTNKEERRTISGYMDDETYDPICDHMFDYHQSIMKKEPFCPRYSHWGYDANECGDDENTKTELQQYLKLDKKLMNQ
jgi:hypothetical protein